MREKVKISEITPATSLVGLWSIGVNGNNDSVKISLSWLKEASDNLTVIKSNAEKATGAANKAATDANNQMVQLSQEANQVINDVDTANKEAILAANAAKEAADSSQKSRTAAEEAKNIAETSANNVNLILRDVPAVINYAKEATNKAISSAELAGQKAAEANVTIIRLEELEESLVGQYKVIPTGINLQYPERITLGNDVEQRIKYELLPVNTGRNVLFLGDNNSVSIMPNGEFSANKLGISTIHVIPTENTNIFKTIQITVAAPNLRTVSSVFRLIGNGNFRLT